MRCFLDDRALTGLLADDCPFGDLTTEALGIADAPGRFSFSARGPMRLCGVEEAVRLCQLAGVDATAYKDSGAALEAGQPILVGTGKASDLHRAWKAAQVLIEWASGIASATAAIVAAAGGIPVACTRKSAPGTKMMAIKAVRAGGATMHRLGISETLLVFHEHRVFLGESPRATVSRLRSREPEKKIVVEVSDRDSALEWARAGADVLQLEKFSPEAVAECRASLLRGDHCPLIAAAGGVNASNAGAYAQSGADLIVTSAPFSAPPRDVAVSFSRC